MPWAESSTIWACRQVTTDPLPPADDPHQPPALIIVNLTHTQPFTHRPSLGDRHRQGKTPAGQT
jgi:hypothetical protein